MRLTKVPSLDLYRPDDPFRTPRRDEFRDAVDVLEFATMCCGAFPEPLTYSLRARRLLRRRRGDLDVVHDNQCLGYGILGIARDGLPVVATIHHPITVDRDLELAQAAAWQRRMRLRRWYGFVRMQKRVLRRLPRLLTVSESSAGDICRQMGARPAQVSVVPVGVDTDWFRPLPHVAKVPGRLMTTASADVALKGLVPLLEALAKVRTERHAELVIVGPPRDGSLVPATIERLGLKGAVTIAGAVDALRMVELYTSAEVAVVPSLYEGFSLPAVEAMACGVALVSTTGGALPEVVGATGRPACWCRPATRGRWPGPSARPSTTPTCAGAWLDRAHDTGVELDRLHRGVGGGVIAAIERHVGARCGTGERELRRIDGRDLELREPAREIEARVAGLAIDVLLERVGLVGISRLAGVEDDRFLTRRIEAHGEHRLLQRNRAAREAGLVELDYGDALVVERVRVEEAVLAILRQHERAAGRVREADRLDAAGILRVGGDIDHGEPGRIAEHRVHARAVGREVDVGRHAGQRDVPALPGLSPSMRTTRTAATPGVRTTANSPDATMSTSSPLASPNGSSVIGIGGTIVGAPAAIVGRSITDTPLSVTTYA